MIDNTDAEKRLLSDATQRDLLHVHTNTHTYKQTLSLFNTSIIHTAHLHASKDSLCVRGKDIQMSWLNLTSLQYENEIFGFI